MGILNPRVLGVGSFGSLDLVRCVRIIQAIGTSSQTPAPVTKHDRSIEVPRGGFHGCVFVARHIKVLAGYFRVFLVFQGGGFFWVRVCLFLGASAQRACDGGPGEDER